jgi:hypothetical protein
MTEATRETLPQRRHNWTQKIRVGGQTFYVCCGEHDDGRLGEIFVDAAKAGSFARTALSSFAVVFSLALQYGVPLPVLLDALRGTSCEPAGPVEGSAEVARADSVFDFLVKQLEATYPQQAGVTP